MSDRRRGLGRGLGALIPPSPTGVDRPSDVFFPRTTSAPAEQGVTTALLDPDPGGTDRDVADNDGRRETGQNDEDQSDEDQSDDDQSDDDQYDSVHHDDDQEQSGHQRHHEAQASDTTGEAAESLALTPVPGARFAEVPVSEITPNPRQPRQVFDEDDMAELEHSIREIGVLQPVVVRSVTTGYELIMGERRLRAATMAGLATIPAIVRDTADDDMLRDALLENLHRAQLNPLEEAAAYQQLLEDFGCTHEVLATRIGRSRPQISNTLRLLKLPPLVQRRVAAGVLSSGHARALLGLSDGAAMERLAQRIVAEGLSVRSVEEIVVLGDKEGPGPRARSPREPQPELEEHAARLADRLDTRVAIAMGKRKGKVTVEFASLEDLDRILELLGAQSSL